MNNTEELQMKAEVQAIIDRYNANGFLLLVLDGDKIKFSGNVKLTSLVPVILKYSAEKLSK